MNSPSSQLALETITQCIFMLRGQKVLLDADLATLYGVETRRLNEQVRRNWERFPHDFMFELTQDEFSNLKSQNATSSWGGRRKLPLAFTEHGAIMAASILSSPRAIEVSVYVVRAFVQLRELVATHQDLAKRLATLESRLEEKTELLAMKHDTLSQNARTQFKQVFDALRALMAPPDHPIQRPIGFVIPEEQKTPKKSDKNPTENSIKGRKDK